MGASLYRGRRACSIENEWLRVTVVAEGGHIAEILDKRTGVNPLWSPKWDSIDPSSLAADRVAFYGGPADGPLLAGILGHNLCLDIFGGPSPEELAAGCTTHGEGSVARYHLVTDGMTMTASATLPLAHLDFQRRLQLRDTSVLISETVTNQSAFDRPIGWTQHATLGAPFVQNGVSEHRCSATRAKVFEHPFGPADYLVPGAVFDWPQAPRIDGGVADLRCFSRAAASSAYTAYLMDPSREQAFFVVYSPEFQLAAGYIWRRQDFPWMGIWEENRSRPQTPWNLDEITWGFEFGCSPFPETRRAMLDRGRLFETPTYRWIPARTAVTCQYEAIVTRAGTIPTELQRRGPL
jgi:hypothetical protein